MKINFVKFFLLLALSVACANCTPHRIHKSQIPPSSPAHGSGELNSRVFEPGTS